MPKNKDIKRIVRARMKKTGESYTSARAVVLAKKTPSPYAAPKAEWAELAGMKDDAVAAKTGRTWAQWVEALDADRAYEKNHTEIAKHLRTAYDGVSSWWAQTVTVGYERIRGLRDVGQRRGGTYEGNKSRTFGVDVSTLFGMFADGRRRKKWLPEGVKRVRTKIEDRSIRFDWDDGTQVNVFFTAKGDSKSSVAIQHAKLASKADADAAKAAWHARLDALKDVLAK